MASTAGLTFRERMAGWFALGETEPQAGARAGAAARTRLVLEVRVLIPDVGRFVADPQHEGDLSGSVSFGPIGLKLPVRTGIVRLFEPTPYPELRRMVYRVTFPGPERSYCFDGAKLVRRRSVLHGWTDTTTLYGRLHASDNADGPAVGAGILRLSPAAFARQLGSFRTVHASTVRSQAAALGGFGIFFSRELIHAYLGRARE